MKKIIIAAIVAAFSVVVAWASEHPVLLPMPKHVEWNNGWHSLPKHLRWYTNVTDKAQRDALASAVEQIASENAAIKKVECAKPRKAQLLLTLSADKQAFATDEAYTLKVTARRIEIAGRTAQALYRGLQTLRQMAFESSQLQLVTISDSPRFADRGVMLDVSRHFFSKEFVKKQIREIAALKMNRLHLHLTDGAGWRIEIKKYPRLTQMAAWRPAQNWKVWRDMGAKYSTEGAKDAFGG